MAKNFVLIENDTKYISKPSKTSHIYGKLTWYFKTHNNPTYVDTIEELVDVIKRIGAFYPWLIDADDVFQGANIITVDFDNHKTDKAPYVANDMLKLARSCGIEPNIVYRTISCSTRKVDKFRFVWAFNGIITTKEDYMALTQTFYQLFSPYADKNSIGWTKWVFTGKRGDKKEIYFMNNTPKDLDMITGNLAYLINSFNTTKGYKSKSTKVPAIPGKSSGYELANINVSVEDIKDACLLYDGASNNEVHLTHNEKMVLVSACNFIKNGTNMFLEMLSNTKNTTSISKWEYQAGWLVDNGYQPYRCETHCRFHKKCGAKNVLSSLDEHTITNSKPNLNSVSPEFVLSVFVEELQELVRTTQKNNDIYIYVLPAGIGKTTKLIEKFSHYGVLAFPNHKLKEEKISEYESHHGKIPQTTLNYKDIVSEQSDLDAIAECFSVGDTHSIKNIISSYSGGAEYLRKTGMPLISSIFTTHDKTLMAKYDESVNNIFYDEDPIDSLFNLTSIGDFSHDIKSLQLCDGLNLTVKNIDFLYGLSKRIHKMEIPAVIKFSQTERKHINGITSKISSAMKNGIKLNINTNIIELINATSFHKDYYSYATPLPNKRVIILSATPDIDFYREVYKDRNVIVRTFNNVTRKGAISHIPISTSKKGLKNTKNINKINELANGKVVTFKQFKHLFDSNNMPHGGNVRGYNYLSGENISIAYTYQKPTIFYAHKVVIQGHKLEKNWHSISRQKVRFKGNVFMYPVFNNSAMKMSQLTSIDNEMYQATERARLMWNENIVTIFSKFMPSFL